MTTEVTEDLTMGVSEATSFLSHYRKMSSFQVKDMRLTMEEPSRLRIKNLVWSTLEQDPVFHLPRGNQSSDKEKIITGLQLKKYTKCGLFDKVHSMPYAEKTKYLMLVNEATEIFNPNLSIKFAVGVSLFSNALLNLGTERHLPFYNDVWAGKILSCLAITELAHGSDTKRLKTTATYDHSTKEFVINTPSLDAAKCWVGNLGMQCTHALLFAQLMVGDVCHGLHPFIVPVREISTHKTFPNILVGDLGEKCGLNGIDNGYILFKNYRIPKDNLLNRTGDINEEGEYETSFKDPHRLLGAVLECLSAGRLGVMIESCNTLTKCAVVSIRYAAQRTQFTDSKGNELPLLEYQSHQWRLFPYLAGTYAAKLFCRSFSEQYIDCVARSQEGLIDMDHGTLIVTGVHALVSCSKAYLTWLARDAIQEAREACGGHGCHRGAMLGDLRNNHDPRVTFEGDNTVLLQQTSNWLLRRFGDDSFPDLDYTSFPMFTIAFFNNQDEILSRKFSFSSLQDVISASFISRTYEWLICWLCKTTIQQMNSLKKFESDSMKVKSLSQVFKARNLALVFAEHNILSYFWKHCTSVDMEIRGVLQNLYYLFGLWSLYKHVPLLYQGSYSSSPELVDLLSQAILRLCSEIKPDAIALVDTIAPPDFILNSVLGYSDGKVYDRLMEVFQSSSVSLEGAWKSKIISKL